MFLESARLAIRCPDLKFVSFHTLPRIAGRVDQRESAPTAVIIGILIIDLLRIYSLLIIVRVVLSWIQADSRNRVVRIVYDLTDPVLQPIQSVVPPIGGTLDISPIIALIFVWLLERLVMMIFF